MISHHNILCQVNKKLPHHCILIFIPNQGTKNFLIKKRTNFPNENKLTKIAINRNPFLKVCFSANNKFELSFHVHFAPYLAFIFILIY